MENQNEYLTVSTKLNMCQLVRCSLAQPTELSIDMSVCFKNKMNNLLLIKLNII